MRARSTGGYDWTEDDPMTPERQTGLREALEELERLIQGTVPREVLLQGVEQVRAALALAQVPSADYAAGRAEALGEVRNCRCSCYGCRAADHMDAGDGE